MGYLMDRKDEIEAECVDTLREIVQDVRALRGDRISAAKELLSRTTPASKHVSVENTHGPMLVYVSSVAQAREALERHARPALGEIVVQEVAEEEDDDAPL